VTRKPIGLIAIQKPCLRAHRNILVVHDNCVPNSGCEHLIKKDEFIVPMGRQG
jgi:hypothetical protein